MNAEQLSRVGEKLVKRCGSRDPFEIARQLGVHVMLCENLGSLKGMYWVITYLRGAWIGSSFCCKLCRRRLHNYQPNICMW